MSTSKVVILGAGFGGLAAARAFRGRKGVEVTIVDRTNHHLFQPLLYQVAVAGLNPSEIASPVRAILKTQKNVTTLMGTVVDVDKENRKIHMEDGLVLDYDYLIIALGGKTSYFGKDEWEKVAPGLKTLTDALDIRHQVLWSFERAEKTEDEALRCKLMSLVVVGGGPTGVELAGALAELTRHVIRWDYRRIRPESAHVYLIEGGDRVLAALPPELSAYAARRLQKMGVTLIFNERVQTIEEGLVVTTDKDGNERRIEAETILWAAGVGGNPLLKKMGWEMDRAGRVKVDADLRVAGEERIYCIGDAAWFQHPHTYDGKALPGVAQVAMQAGRLAALNVLSHMAGRPLKPFSYFDKGVMATIGRSSAVVSSGWLKLVGFPAWVAWLLIHVLYIADFRNRVLVTIRWAWAYLTWKWGARLITKEPRKQEEEVELPVHA